MKWPWVSRWAFEFVRDQLADERTHSAELAIRHDALLDKYHALKVQGASIPEAPKPIAPVDPVSAAITQAAGHDPRLRAIMAKEAARMRQAQFTDHEIIEAIQNGVTSMEGLPA